MKELTAEEHRLDTGANGLGGREASKSTFPCIGEEEPTVQAPAARRIKTEKRVALK